MIAPARSARRREPAWHAPFLDMLPAIVRAARHSFRTLDPERRDDAVQEVVANACQAYCRLVQLDKPDLAYPQALARYAVAQYRDGRRVGNRLNVHDVLSPYAQRRKAIRVDRLDRRDPDSDEWLEAVVEDPHTRPPENAAFRIDFSNWLATLPARRRRIALTLARGEPTVSAAARFGMSPGRISQLRRVFRDAWQSFQSQPHAASTINGEANRRSRPIAGR